MLWYLVICAMMLYPYAIARAGTLTGRSTKHIALMTACVILWFFMAFRGSRVGVDTKHYAYVFSQFRNIPFSKVFTAVTYANESESWAFDFEPGYRLLNKLVSLFTTDPQAITIVNSTLILLLVFRLIRIIPEGYPAMQLVMPVGGFLALGFLVAGFQWYMKRMQKGRKKEVAKK